MRGHIEGERTKKKDGEEEEVEGLPEMRLFGSYSKILKRRLRSWSSSGAR